MGIEVKQKNLQILYSFFLVFFLLATNRWLPWQQSIEYSQANDVLLYEKISDAAPHFLTEPITHHHAQRFLSHYLVGSFSHYIHITTGDCYRAVSILLVLACLICAQKILNRFRLAEPARFSLLAIFLLNPYATRYYLLAFGMCQDLGFMLGTLLLILAILDANIPLLLFSCIFSTVCRQTALMLIPGLLLWIMRASPWKEFTPKKRNLTAASAVITILLSYILTDRLSRSFSLPSQNLNHMIGLFHEWQNSTIPLKTKFSDFLELFLRVLIPFFLPLSLFFLLWKKKLFQSVELWASILIITAIVAQPVLAGSLLTGKNGSRLSALALAFVLVPLALAFQESKYIYNQKFYYLALAFIALASFHHIYSVIGPSSALQFLLWQISLAIGLFYLGRRVA